MHSSLDHVEFLSRSENRVRVLDAVHERPRTRNELKELTDASRFTLSRILADFEDRGWIVRAGEQYETTGTGGVVAAEFETLLANLDVAESLDGTLEWLQVEEFDFDLARLQDAEVITPSQSDHTAHIRRPVEVLHASSHVRAIATGVAYEMIEAVRETTVEGDLRLEGVLDAESFEVVRTAPELAALFREAVAADGTEVFRYDGDETLVMLILGDDGVLMCGHDDDGPAPGTIETTDPVVRSWAESYFESVRADATPVETDAFGTVAE
jgi:predicted transcriptional regulator